MSKTAFIFPGQGAQYTGMGKDFYEQFEEAKHIYELAGEASSMDVRELCFEENDKLNITKYTQLAMLTTEIAILRCAAARGLSCSVTAGLSLGEYASLEAVNAIETGSLLKIITKRGLYMQEAYPQGGAMSAVLGMEAAVIEEVCAQIAGEVSVANYNCPGQIVITGEELAVKAAGEELARKGAKRCVPLKVSGPFHSPLMEQASKKLEKDLALVEVKDPVIPYVSNVTAEYVSSAADIRSLLARQVCSSVRWEQSVRLMINDGVDVFVEIGPGKTLSKFVKKIDKNVKVYNIEKVADLEQTAKELLC